MVSILLGRRVFEMSGTEGARPPMSTKVPRYSVLDAFSPISNLVCFLLLFTVDIGGRDVACCLYLEYDLRDSGASPQLLLTSST